MVRSRLHTQAAWYPIKQRLHRLNLNQLPTWGGGGRGVAVRLGEGSLPHESCGNAAGKIIKGLTAILVGHLLLNQNVSSISCPPEASGPRFLCLLQT